ncbi:circularly permuted type 2 ATP-grasp protein [Methylobacterium sp. J-090]|uniref:circularly permuted type 2 ATP-grasp protein n=1 Tax=Methylobacterium sp. J-090 TaxID=2836666 RepID=UPI001FB8DA38|nr:circularly permuted type 2 ATP-grasp protein [Methylobacterium sp. J-090]MCJ2081076.1 circularly permuted type 2 ATP-grasp protein [Methylobacterium sp. J-090]
MSEAAEAEVSGRAERLARWTSGYRPHPGVPDAFMDEAGTPQAAWTRVLDRLGDLTEVDIAARFVSAVRHIRDTGISYRIYGDKRDHAWPLGSLPFVVEAADWKDLSAGIVERAELMEAILADIYGPGRLVADGLLPAAVVAGSPEFMRPVAGIAPPGGRFLKLYAADVTRGPDGRWQVLADRTQSPSGPGYALENRMVLTRAFPDLYTDLHVERLAPFFQAFRQGLALGAQRSDPRICLLTSGPFSSTYVEQAVLARYLGLLLVEGDDLVMQDGALHVRTVSGLKRADVLWRRIDSDYVDPLELNPASRLGVPGLIDGLRNASLVVGNMPGSGILESGALAAYLPGIARRFLGAEPRLSGPRTWWCGDPDSLAHVRDNLDALTLRPVATPPKGMARDAIMGPLAFGADRERVVAALRDRPFDYVAQERAPLATTPGWDRTGGTLRLVPRPFALRVFAALTPDGWRVMPGGFCRISERADIDPIEMRAGIKAADVWIMSDGPVESGPLIQPAAQKVRRIAGHLPSRAADNLFWFGRYVERAEAVIRLVIAHLGSVGAAVITDLPGDANSPTSLRIRALLDEWGAISAPDLPTAALAREALSGREVYGSALSHGLSARSNAAILRERLSGEAWRVLADLKDILDIGTERPYSEAELVGLAERALGLIAALAGLAQENMNRTAGWHFVDLGRRIERVINTCAFATRFAGDAATAEDFGVMLSLCDSHIAFGARYMQGAALDPVRDMVLLDPFNPRSVAFQVEAIERHLASLPILRVDGLPEPHQRLAAKLAAEFATGEASEFDGAALARLENEFERLADAIATRYFPNGPHALRPEKLVGLG